MKNISHQHTSNQPYQGIGLRVLNQIFYYHMRIKYRVSYRFLFLMTRPS